VEIRRAGCNGVLVLQAEHRKTGVRHVWYSTTELGGRMNRRMSQGRRVDLVLQPLKMTRGLRHFVG